MKRLLLPLLFAAYMSGAVPLHSAPPVEFKKGEHVVFVGNSLAERMNLFGNFETLLHSRFPEAELKVRNFARPADEVSIQQRPTDYTKLDDPIAVFGPETVFCFFGFNESFAGPKGVEKFKSDYEAFLDEFTKTYGKGKELKVILVSPIAFEATGNPLLPDAAKQNGNLKLYADAVATVAKKRDLPFADIYSSTEALFNKEPGMQFTINGAHLNEAGDREVAQYLDREIFGTTNPAKIGSAQYEQLRAAVNDKSWIHLQDYRMLNGWYVYGGRRTYDEETFPTEYKKIRNMAAVRDQYVSAIAQGKPVPEKPDDSNTGELFTPKTGFGSVPKSEPKELRYLSPEESIKTMEVPEGFEVQLFASDREFPELAKPDQINFDNKGRLWVSCMPTYPQWRPGEPRPSDRLLIFEDKDHDGKADECKVFYDKLICPTGFEFWNGGVLVVDEPRILFLKDTDGDDKADQVVQLFDGWGTDDTHHCVNAWEWSNGGLLHMLEGISLSTAVETAWGAFRNYGTPGAYVLDPASQKLRHFVTPGYGNPWCYVFNPWGQGIVGDGTSAQQHWDSLLSGAQFSGRRGVNPVADNQSMRPAVGNEFLYSRQFPDDVQGQFIYACVINMNGLVRFDLHDSGAGYDGKRTTDLIKSTDKNFRPVDPIIGPDGSLWFGDWCNALIGHMQYSQRDPNRDHTRGRIYRLVYTKKPLLKPVTQFGKPVQELLEQLKEYEPRTRYRVRSELRARPAGEVLGAVKSWVSGLNASDSEYDRLVMEALSIQQAFHAVDVDLLKQALHAKTGDARAIATHLLSDVWDEVPNPLELLKPQVDDPFPRTRLEAVRALSFVRTKEAAELALNVTNYPMDYWLEYTLQMTLGALESHWKAAHKKNQFAANNPKALAFLTDYEAVMKPNGAATKQLALLLTGKPNEVEREHAYGELAGAKGDVKNGKAIFSRICVACHKVGNEGVEYGPDLSKVAGRLTKHDIVESVIDPNAKMAPEFVMVNIETNAGEAFSGFVQTETDTELTLRIAGGQQKTLQKADIRKRESVKQSGMPEGLAAAMSAAEFVDLLEFLKSLK